MKLLAELGIYSCCLENCCVAIACGQLFVLVLGGMLSPGLLDERQYVCSFVISVMANLILILAATFRIQWLLLAWFVYTFLLLLGMPYGIESYVGYFRVLYETAIDNRFLTFTLEYFVMAVLYCYFNRIVLSYYVQLRGKKAVGALISK